MDRIYNPVDARITTNHFMLRINKDYFEVLISGILVNPVRVKHPQICAAASNTLLRSRFERPLVLKLIYTLVGWLAYMSIQLTNRFERVR